MLPINSPGGRLKALLDRLDQPLRVSSPAPSAPAIATIALGASLTAAIDLQDERLHRVVMPAAWTGAALTFLTSHNGVAWSDLYGEAGEYTLSAANAAAGHSVVVDQPTFYGIRYLKIRSGTAAAAVVQVAERTITLVTVAR
jgi:hypothetical protein